MGLFNKILIANRGEIAIRIIKAAKSLRIKTVAIYSEVDSESLHKDLADESYLIGKHELSETYLNIPKIIQTAKEAECDAIHPGYGFLSENPEFVKACDNAGITFIGPKADAIKLMGNKIEARKSVEKIGTPMTKAITGTFDELMKAADEIPFPLLVKAAAGGGGKGMRIVREKSHLKDVLKSTSREAKSYFGDDSIFVEQFIEDPRHIEIQVLGDKHGNIIHVYERECSIQRRYQKIIEESPSPTLNDEVREKMGADAVKIAESINYDSAGTIEFLVDKNLNYYFLEMNTRIQVEHPVTELVTGIDLVEEQIKIAAGEKLQIRQSDVKQCGNAIEARIYAEDAENNFTPAPGDINYYYQPQSENVRIDTGLKSRNTNNLDKVKLFECKGSNSRLLNPELEQFTKVNEHKSGENKEEVEFLHQTIQSSFDPMISKVIGYGKNRDEARFALIESLENHAIHGIKTNITFLTAMLNSDQFISNNISTKFCDLHADLILDEINKKRESIDINEYLIGFTLHSFELNKIQKDVWDKIGFWRINRELKISFNDKEYLISINKKSEKEFQFIIDNKTFNADVLSAGKNTIEFATEDIYKKFHISLSPENKYIINEKEFNFTISRKDELIEEDFFTSEESAESEAVIHSPMPGKIIEIKVKEGDKISKGDTLLIVEAMKMENSIKSGIDAEVEKINIKEGDAVGTSEILIELKE